MLSLFRASRSRIAPAATASTLFVRQGSRNTATMATAYTMQISPDNTGLWRLRQTEEAAAKATELLQKDLKEHHVFFNAEGFHNHISHHVLALYGTGAAAAQLQQGYDANASYQRPAMPPHAGVPEELRRDWHAAAPRYLGREEHYPDFLLFFQREIERRGHEDVLAEYVFKGDELADDLLVRLYAGFLHPLIQLMYGLEWRQPAIVAEALAQLCVHGTDLKEFLLTSERMVRESAGASSSSPTPPILSLYEAVRADEAIARAPRMSDANKIRDGVLVRARDEMLRVAAQVRVVPSGDELDERTMEMFNACVFVAAAAAVRPPAKHKGKGVKFDFFLMHHVNSSPFFLTLNALHWVPAQTKARLLEWKIRMDLVQYAARGSPPLPGAEADIAAYRSPSSPTAQPGHGGKTATAAADGGGHSHEGGFPEAPDVAPPLDVVCRLHTFEDDGHAIKLARAVGACQIASGPYAHRAWAKLSGDGSGTKAAKKSLWRQVQQMIVDSVEAPGPHWVRSTGLEEAWEEVPQQPKM